MSASSASLQTHQAVWWGQLLEGSDAIQRNLDKVDRWTYANLMKFDKAKFKILHLGRSKPQYEYRLGDEVIEGSRVKKDLGIKSWT